MKKTMIKLDSDQLGNVNEVELFFLDVEPRDFVLILPGGGYAYTADREGLPVSQSFNKEGFHSGIYHYRKNMLTYPSLLEEGFSVVESLREDRRIKNLYVCGFSAGGHFALLLLEEASSMIDGGILAYPVVTADDKFAHIDSFVQLYGRTPTEEEKKKVSLEYHVTEDTPPIYLWHTIPDDCVPVENAIFLEEALRKNHVLHECHLFPKGGHGLSLANELTPYDGNDPIVFAKEHHYVSKWFHEAVAFLKLIQKK